MDGSNARSGNSITSIQNYVSTNQKYGGLIHDSVLKKVKTGLTAFMTHVFTVSPPWQYVHIFISTYRIIQFYFFSFCPGFKGLWTGTDLASHISTFACFFPSDVIESNSKIILLFFSALTVVFFAIVGISSFSLARYGKCSRPAVMIVYFYVSILGYLVITSSSYVSGCSIAMTLTNNGKILYVLNPLISFLLTLVYLWFMHNYVYMSTLFRPSSLPSLTVNPQIMALWFFSIEEFLMGLSAYSTGMLQMIFLVLTLGCYLGTWACGSYQGGFLKIRNSGLIQAVSIGGGISLVVFSVLLWMKKPSRLEFLFGFAFFDIAL